MQPEGTITIKTLARAGQDLPPQAEHGCQVISTSLWFYLWWGCETGMNYGGFPSAGTEGARPRFEGQRYVRRFDTMIVSSLPHSGAALGLGRGASI